MSDPRTPSTRPSALPPPSEDAITSFIIPPSPRSSAVSSFTSINSQLDLASSQGKPSPASPDSRHALAHPPLKKPPIPPTLHTSADDDAPHDAPKPKPPKLPKWTTYRAVLAHALRGAARSFVLAYLGRAALLSALRILAALRKSPPPLTTLLQPFISIAALRSGAAFGTFSFVWKLVANVVAKRRGRWTFGGGFLAGLLASPALLLEDPSRRGVLVEQLGVRALQAVAVRGHAGGYVRVWEGAALTFILACTQIMYAYIMRPTTIPPAYYQWMVKTANVPDALLELNRRNIRLLSAPLSDPTLTHSHALSVASRFAGSASRMAEVERSLGEYVARATGGSMTYPIPIVPCELLHPQDGNCVRYDVGLWGKVFVGIFPVYVALNYIPLVLFRTKSLLKHPLPLILKTLRSTVQSSVFLAFYVTIYMVQICIWRRVVKSGWVAKDHRFMYWLFAIPCAASIFIEKPSRRAELSMYVLPKAFEALWHILLAHDMAAPVPGWEVGVFAASMGTIMGFYHTEPEVLSNLLNGLIHRVFGAY
ncbi:hypothetical protein M427DRAFT_64158 [Gonapodya prolifera JEL478]|uniref:Transmembrane protein 135 N-terminal domain-containing protein n=1 Tax=Gonapodya prolifera (strain JEL478) TaxID=1344416 RepID=A0A138ZY57_GONPJ|nr:hypothetical protein M427DRAFT_64158 [Gonapodya prolifera JEL478]|eukprot:KXS09424.1 hypothetical protein M427DRAFT_64158 [Gonapodya prolifera JEL478]